MNRINVWKSALVLAVVAALLAGASEASADLIVQSGAHLAFEAESYSSLIDVNSDGDSWQLLSEGTASGGVALQATGTDSGTSFTHSNDGEAVYDVEFTKASDFYRVFARAKNLGTSASDAIFTTNLFGTSPTTNRELGNSATGIGDYHYIFIASGTITAGTYEFRTAIKEKNVVVDRFLFLDASVFPGSAPGAGGGLNAVGVLDGVANSPITVTSVPEPTAFAFGSLVVMLIGTSKRRRG